MNTLEYGYGHSKESAAIVRRALKDSLGWHIKQYRLKVSVKKADCGYGGPRVSIRTNHVAFMDYYEYIVDENGKPSDAGRLVRVPAHDMPRPHYTARLIRSSENSVDARATDNKVREILSQFGRNNNDAMTDYFDNTSPLFYGVEYEAAD